MCSSFGMTELPGNERTLDARPRHRRQEQDKFQFPAHERGRSTRSNRRRLLELYDSNSVRAVNFPATILARMFTNIFTRDEEESWWDRARDERNGVVIPPPDPPAHITHAAHGVGTPALSTNPAHPATGKVYRPGERLERQARKFVQKQDPPARKRRDYNTLIARALEELG